MLRWLRWAFWQVIIVPADLCFVAAGAITAALACMVAVARARKTLLPRRGGEAGQWRQELRQARSALILYLRSLKTVSVAHSVRVGEV